MKLSIPVFLTLALLLLVFSFVRADAVSADSGILTTPQTAPGTLTSTITSTGVLTTVNLTGVIVSGSGSNLPTPISVTLYAYQPSSSAMDLIFTTTTIAQTGGDFAFDHVAKPDGMVYMTSATYAGLPYHSTPSMGEPMTITVFDVTTATGHLMADQLHLIFSFSATGDLEVMEVYILTNVGTQTIVGGQGQLLVDFPIPEGALNPDFRSGLVGEAELETHDGFWEIPAVRPGGLYGVSYAFTLPYAKKATLNQPVALPINAVGVLLPAQGNLKIESAGLVDGGLSDFGGTSYHVYSGESLQAGTQLTIKISGDPNASPSSAGQASSGSRVGLIIGFGAFGLVLILAGVWISRRNHIDSPEIEADVAEEEETEQDFPRGESLASAQDQPESSADADTLMDDIIALDDLYQAGELPEAAYRERRAELKEKLGVILGDKE